MFVLSFSNQQSNSIAENNTSLLDVQSLIIVKKRINFVSWKIENVWSQVVVQVQQPFDRNVDNGNSENFTSDNENSI